VLPLSYAQQRLWFFNMLEGPSSAYNVPLVITLRGALDVPALERALGDLTARHESLRTLFVESDGEPHQHILPVEQARLAVPVVECAAGAVESTVRELARRPFDLGADAPVRVWLLRVSADQHRLLVVMHHAVCDGWSMTPLLRDLERAYNARAAGGQAGWDPLPVQYSDNKLWQRELLGSDNDEDSVGSRQLRYWRDELTGLPEELALPFDRVRPAVASQRGQEINFRVRAEVHAALQDIARQTRSTLFMVLQAAVAAVLARLGAGTDIPWVPRSPAGPTRRWTTWSARSSTRWWYAPTCPMIRPSVSWWSGSGSAAWSRTSTRICPSNAWWRG
jgi:hypothetical protein